MFRAHVLIIRRSKLRYTASGIITPIGGRLVHRGYQRLCNAILTSSWWSHVLETCRGMNELIVKQKFCASSWLITEINILRCTVSETSKFLLLVVCRIFLSSLLLCNTSSFIVYCPVWYFNFNNTVNWYLWCSVIVYREVEVQLNVFLTLALDELICHFYIPAVFCLWGKISPVSKFFSVGGNVRPLACRRPETNRIIRDDPVYEHPVN